MPILAEVGAAILKPLLQVLFWVVLALVAWFAIKHFFAVKAATDAALSALDAVRVRRNIETKIKAETDEEIDNALRPPERRK